MQEYTPLMSALSDDGAYSDEIKPGEPADQTHAPRYHLLLTVIIALIAIGAAAAFHLSVLSDAQPLLTPKEISSRLRMAEPSPNLEKGRSIMVKKLRGMSIISRGVHPNCDELNSNASPANDISKVHDASKRCFTRHGLQLWICGRT